VTPRQTAKEAGLKTYRTGSPCKNGHGSDRYVSDSSCVDCAIARGQKRYEKKSEGIKAYSRDRYHSDPDKYSAQVRLRRKNSPEKVREEKRAEYLKHKSIYVQRAKAWRLENPESVRKAARDWHKQNPEKSYAAVVKRRMAKLNRTPVWLTAEQRNEIARVYRKARGLTISTGISHQVDHVVPLRNKRVSGLHVPWNLQILTANQNQSKGNRLGPNE